MESTIRIIDAKNDQYRAIPLACLGRGALTFTLNGALQTLRIPGHDAVGEQG